MPKITIKQRDITDCGAACLASVAAHYKLRLPVSRIRQMASTDKKGTNVLGLVKAAEKLGFSAKGVKGGADALPKIPLPAIAHIVVKKVLHHYVVLYKVSKKYIHLMDPADGRIHKKPIELFLKEWTGVLVLLVPNEDFQKGNEKISHIRRFLYLLSPHRSIMIQALFGAVVYTVLGLSVSIYIQKITDYVLVDGNKNLLNLLSVIMLILLVLQIFIGIMKSVFMLKTGQKIDARLILGYYKHLLKLPQRFFDTMRVGEIISRINDAVKIRAFINDTAISMLVNIFIVVFAFSLMFIYHWKLALIMAIVVPLYVIIYTITNRLNKRVERRLMENSAELESQLVESLNSVKTIKQFRLEEYANIKTETRFITLLHTTYKSGMNYIFTGNSSEFLSRIFTIILLWSGSYYVLNGAITPGELLSFYALIGYFTQPAAELTGMNKMIQNALISADRLFELMDIEREKETQKMNLEPALLGDIIFKNVSFSYGTRVDVFNDFNLVIRKGEITAIIDESGSGKTTLTALMQKLYPLTKGSISSGKYDINHISYESLKSIIGIVPQTIHLFAGSILENIAIGDYEPDMQKITSICERLGISDYISNLPQGFNTYVGENGVTLSGGQKQRIAIARALYRDPKILILDEATSNLDSESEFFVKKFISQMRKEAKTILIIAHRLSTVINADTIVILEKGKVIEQGNHKELYEQKGTYFNMWQRQLPYSTW